jgi:hypothetical protein
MANDDATWAARFSRLQASLLSRIPHLAEQRRCGLCRDSDQLLRRVRLPNGFVLFSAWYKVPTTERDAKLARRESDWLYERQCQQLECEL